MQLSKEFMNLNGAIEKAGGAAAVLCPGRVAALSAAAVLSPGRVAAPSRTEAPMGGVIIWQKFDLMIISSGVKIGISNFGRNRAQRRASSEHSEPRVARRHLRRQPTPT